MLVAATAVLLGLGGWWWVANAPAPAVPVQLAAPPSPTGAPTGDPAVHPNPSEIVRFDVAQVEELLPERDEVIPGGPGC